LNAQLCGLIEDHSLVSFFVLNINDKESMMILLQNIDKSNGYIFGALTPANESIMEVIEVNWAEKRNEKIDEIQNIMNERIKKEEDLKKNIPNLIKQEKKKMESQNMEDLTSDWQF